MGNAAHIIIPLTYVPLNASHCMCESLTQLKDNINSPTETNCVTDSKCVGIECDLIVDDHTYLIDTQIFPCANPPGMRSSCGCGWWVWPLSVCAHGCCNFVYMRIIILNM